MKIIELILKFPSLVAFIDKVSHIWIVYRYEQRRDLRESHVESLKNAKSDQERREIVKRIADSFKVVV